MTSSDVEHSKNNGCLLSLRRIFLLLWKNILFRRRHYVVTAFEIILPCIMAALLILIRSTFESDNDSFSLVESGNERIVFPEFDEEGLVTDGQMAWCNSNCTILFAPRNTLTEKIIDEYIIKSSDYNFNEPVNRKMGFATEKELEVAYLDSEVYREGKPELDVPFGVIFNDGFDLDPTNHKFSYKLRLTLRNGWAEPTNVLIPWFQEPGPNQMNSRAYINNGFLLTQFIIEKSIIEVVTKNSTNDNAIKEKIVVQAFPYPEVKTGTNFNQIYFLLLPQLLVLGFVFIVPSIVRTIVSEKETGIKELMKMMGLPNWMHWLGWMLNSLFILIFSITIVTILFFVAFDSKLGPFIQYADATLFWVMLFFYAISITSFCFFVSAFFERPTIATIVGIALYLISYNAIAQIIELRYEEISLAEKLCSSLIPSVALHMALKVMGGFEGKAVGSKWSNFGESASSVDSLTLGHCFLMLAIDALLYMFLAIYIENIIPTKYGVRKPWYYIFLPSTYFGKKPISSENIAESIRRGSNSGKPGFEPEPIGLTAGIVIQNLSKVFGNGKIAVDNISCKMYDGQITALLGHNGAGKTTTMSILTGLYASTSGTATINGYDIKNNMDSIRDSLGLCPQHNMLFDKLTVQEHLIFFGRLKGMSSSDAHSEMKALLEKLKLKEKRHVLSMSLSGGQKRKLSLGMALIGGTKVVVLDEPTSGMDPEARRAIWDILLEMRGERTILLTTHFMEEADILGDRIAIMSSGKLQCCGTPMFLKQFYGAGYSLKMTIGPQSPVNQIIQTIQKYIPGAFIKSELAPNSSEISITLPSDDSTTAIFPEMFSELSKLKENYQILTIGISLTTMDEVFVKASELSEDSHSDLNEFKSTDLNANSNQHDKSFTKQSRSSHRVVGLTLIFQQFWGLLLKRMIYTMKKYLMFLIQFALPILLVIASILISNTTLRGSESEPPLKMELSTYKDTKTLYTASRNIDNAEKLGKSYDSVVRSSVDRADGDITDALISFAEKDLGSYRAQYIVAAAFNETTAKALFSTIPNHAAPLALNLVSNAILKSRENYDGYSIELTVHPLPSIYNLDNVLDGNSNSIVAILFGVLVPFGLAGAAASYLIFPVEERLCKAKQLQLMTGVSPIIYWATSYLWDFFLMIVLIAIMVACFPIFENYEAFTSNGGAGVIFLILTAYGFAAISFSYLLSHFVATVAGGFSVVLLIHLVTGMMVSMGVFFLEEAGNANTVLIVRIIGTFFPTFTVSTSLMKYTTISNANSKCNIIKEATLEIICSPNFEFPYNDYGGQECCKNCADFKSGCFQPKPYITWMHRYSNNDEEVVGIGQDITYLFVLGIIYIGLTLLVEYGIFRRIFSFAIKSDKSDFQEMSNDDDVQAESQRVRTLISSGRTNEDALLASDMCKSYSSLAAVSKLSFGVHHGECFGLLGVNGAGKTTTFRMLTGDEISSSGNAFAQMYTILNNRSNFLSNIGYCPQFDGIVDVLSGRQMLQLFCRLRGIPKDSLEAETNRWLHKLGLYESGDVQCQKYSGGMKRRLSAAIALVGDLPLIMLDEPTSGVDPVARRQFWSVIESVRDSGQAVILTSHSMEECESLCSRLGIMVNGQFQCMGGVQHLKNKFAQGYSLLLKLKPMLSPDSPRIDALNTEICLKFHPCTLKDRHQNVLKYQVYDTSMPWDVLFKNMEDFKIKFEDIIEDYSVSETSLEEVFLSFARKQYPNRIANVSLFKKIITCQF